MSGGSATKRAIIIDTDPGQDDAIAILLALASPELDIVGITAVAGNVPLALTEKNARKICELAGKPETPVYAGAPRPLVRPLVTAEYVHGKTGLDGPNLPEPKNLIYSFVRTIYNKQLLVLLLILLYKLQTQICCSSIHYLKI